MVRLLGVKGHVNRSLSTTLSERHGLVEPKKVESLQTKIINSLRDHVTYNPEAQRKPQYFTRILDKLQVLRRGKYRGNFLTPCCFRC